MSTVIDQRVAELRFDNANFEKNVATSMSTLDKLKNALHLTGASKGLEEVGAAARSINFNPLSLAIDQVGIKFKATTTMADQFFRNLTNSFQNTVKRLGHSLTIDQLTAGWDKYNDKTSSVQTIMNATGKSIEEVNGYLQRLMDFSDETSYSFVDMTAGLATMVSSGGDINKLIPLITGVANATAFAGKGAAEFSRVLQYGVNQAYSLGYMQQQDWKTIEGATVNSKQLMQALIDAGEALGKIEKGQVTVSNFRSTLQDKWLDTEVMEQGFGAFSEFSQAVFDFMDGDLDGFSDEIKALYDPEAQYTASEVIDLLGDKYAELGVKAFKSAQEAKTFSEAIDATKDAVSSGWMKTYEIIVGDYEKAKKLWTDVANFLYYVFAGGAERRNNILEMAFGKDFLKPLEKVKDIVEKVKEPIEAVTESLQDYNKVVQEILGGKWGNGQARWDALAAAGYDWAHAQNLVNERLGSTVRHATNYSEATAKVSKATEKAADSQGKLVAGLIEMQDSDLLDAGYSKKQIKNLREVEKLARKLGISVEELVDNADEIDGRWILLDSFKNIGNTILKIFGAIKEAWNDAFGFTDEQAGQFLFDLIAAFHRFTEAIQISDETAAKITSTFKGLFAILDILVSVVLTPIKIAFNLLAKAMGLTGGGFKSVTGGVLDFTAAVGENIAKFRDWLEEHNVIRESFEKLIEVVGDFIQKIAGLKVVQDVFTTIKDSLVKIKEVLSDLFGGWGKTIRELWKLTENGSMTAGEAATKMASTIDKDLRGAMKAIPVNQWVDDCSKLPVVGKVVEACSKAFIKFKEVLENVFGGSLGKFNEFGVNITDGLGSGLKNGISKVLSAVVTFAKMLWTTFAGELGINSPSKVFKWLGQMCIDGFMLSFKKTSAGKIIIGIMELVKLILNPFKKALGINSPSKKFMEFGRNCIEGFFIGIKELLPKVGEFFKNLGLNLLDAAKKIEWDKLIIIGLGIGAFVGINKTLENVNKTCTTLLSPLKDVSGAFREWGKSITGFTNQLTEMAKAKKFKTYAFSVLMMALAIGVLIAAVVVISKIPVGKLWASIGALAALTLIMVGLAVACEKLNSAGEFGLNALSILAIGGSILLLATTLKILSTIDSDKALSSIAMFIAIVASLGVLIVAIGKCIQGSTAVNISKVGTLLIKLSVAFLLMVAVIKIAASLDGTTVGRGIGVLTLVELLFLGIIAVCKCVGQADASKAGSLLFKMSLAMILMVAVVKLASKLSPVEVFKGLAFVTAVGILFAAIIAVSYFAGKNGDRAGKMLLGVSFAMLMMIAVVKIAARLKPWEVTKGIDVLKQFTLLVGILIAVSRLAGEHSDKIAQMMIGISISMLIMVGILIILKSLDPKGLGRALGVFTILGGICAGLIYVCGTIKDPDKVMKMLIVLAVIIALLCGTVIALSVLPQKKVATAGAVLSAIIAAFALLVKATSYLTANEKTWKRSLVVLGTLVLVVAGLAAIIYALSYVKNAEQAAIAASGVSVMLLAVAGAVRILDGTKEFKEGRIRNILNTVGILAGLLIVLAVVLLIMDGVDGAHAMGNAVAISILLTALALITEKLMLLDGRKTQKLPKIIANIALLSGVMIILAVVLDYMKDIPAERGLVNATAITELIIVLTGVVIALNRFGSTKGATKGSLERNVLSIGALSLVMLELTGVLAIMNCLDVNKSIPNATALSELLIVLAGITVLLSQKFVGKDVVLWKSALTMAALGGVMYELSGVMAIMNLLDSDKSIPNATALSELMIVLTGVMAAMTGLGNFTAQMWSGVGAFAVMALILGLLAGVLILMDKFVDPDKAIKNVRALNEFMLAMSVAILILTGVGAIIGATAGIAAVGLAAPLVIITTVLLPLVTILAAMQFLPDATKNAKVLTDIMYAISVLVIVLSTVGILSIAAAPAVSILMGVIISVLALTVLIGKLMSDYSSLETFVDKGIGLLIKMAEGIGKMIGAIYKGALTGIAESLPSFATALTGFMTNLSGFIEGAKGLGDDKNFKKGIETLVETLLIFMAVEFLNGMIKFSTLGLGSLPVLGMELSNFMKSAKGFIDGAQELDPNLMKGVKTLSEAILMLTAAKFIEGIGRFILGGVNYAQFARGMEELGTGVEKFISKVGTLDGSHVQTAQCAADIVSLLASAASSIPNTGGWLAKLVGDNDLETWAGGLGTVAQGVSDFCNTLSKNKITTDSVKLAENAASIVTKLAGAAAKIPNSGGWLAAIMGDNDLESWSGCLGTLGEGISAFCGHFEGTKLTEDQVKIAELAGKVIGVLAEASEKIPNAGGWIAKFIGDNNQLTEWATSVPELAEGVTGFVANLGEFSETDVDKAKASGKLLAAIADMADANGILLGTNIAKLGEFVVSMPKIAEAVKKFVNKLKDISAENIQAASDSLNGVLNLLKTAAENTDIESLNTFGESLKTVASESMTGVVDAFESEDAKTKINTAGGALIDSFVSGMDGKKNKPKEKAEEATNKAHKAAGSKTMKANFKTAGLNCIQGFINGLKNEEKMAEVTAAGTAIGNAAYEAAMKALDEHSPSRKMYQVGEYAAIGFTNALFDNESTAYDAGTSVANYAKDGLTKAIAKVNSWFNDEITTQPTIRPVVDLSNVTSGAAAIDGMFGSKSIGLTANLNSINSRMNGIQNGGNDDVVDAINRLRKEINKVGGTNNYINGVNAGNDESVTDAINTIVGYARRDRRS